MLKTLPQILRQDVIHFAEVRFYFTKSVGGATRAFALVSPYSAPDEYLLQVSNGTLVACRYQGNDVLWIIDVTSILAVIAMVPFPFVLNGQDNYHYMVEKIGLDVIDVDVQEDEDT